MVIRRFPAILGRTANADVPIRDPWASQTHCVLKEVNGTLVVRDLGSKNGIFLHGHRVSESELLPGDRFTVGRTEIAVHYQRVTQTGAEPPVAESGVPPIQITPSPPAPETRELLFGPGDTAQPDSPPEDKEPLPPRLTG